MTESVRRGRPPLVLVVNDQEWSTRSLDTILGPNGYAVLRAYTGAKGVERARSAHPDMVIVDANLPDMDGLDVCRELRDSGIISATTPVVMMTTGHPTRQQRLEALRAGAWEYLGHPIDAEELLLRFDTYTRAKQEADRARDEGLLDQITGLYNVHGLARRARELGSQAFRQHGPLACVVLSPEIADEAGRPLDEGEIDALTTRIATVLRETGRVSDAIGRVGEAEFAVFAPGTDAEGAEGFARRIAQRVETEHGGKVRLRAGYHAVKDFREASIEPVDLLRRASSALHMRPSGPTEGGVEWIQGFESTVSTS